MDLTKAKESFARAKLRVAQTKPARALSDVLDVAPVSAAWVFAGVAMSVFALTLVLTTPQSTPTPETPGAKGVDAVVEDVTAVREKARRDVVAELEAKRLEAKHSAEAAAAESESEPEPESAFSTTDFSDTLCVGDGVMLFAHDQLVAALPGAQIDALRGRTYDTGGAQTAWDETKGVLDLVRVDGGAHARYVVGTGNEEWQGLDSIRLRELVDAVDGAELFLVTQYVSDNAISTTTTNASITSLAAEFKNVHVCDWHAWIVEHRDQLRDNCDPETDIAKAQYASIVKATMEEAANA